eukprot:1415488-Pyramimonas_sp.AAC.1
MLLHWEVLSGVARSVCLSGPYLGPGPGTARSPTCDANIIVRLRAGAMNGFLGPPQEQHPRACKPSTSGPHEPASSVA